MADRDLEFRRLLDVYHPKVYRLALSYLKNSTAAEDATQEVFLRAWKHWDRFRSDASLSTWIYSIARNFCLDQLKRPRAVGMIDQPISPDIPRIFDSEIEGALNRLPADLEQAVRLYYWEEKSYQEVADMMGLPIGTIKSHLYRAKERLAEMLDAPSRMKEDSHGRT